MNIHEAARMHLLNYPGIQELVGQRIYWRRKPENMKETCISFFRVSHNKDTEIDRYTSRFQFDVWSTSGAEALAAAELVEKAFDRFKGLMGEKPVKQGRFSNMQEFYEEDTGIYHIPVDVIFHYYEY